MSFFVGLSILPDKGGAHKKVSSAEARRILSLLEETPIDENSIARDGQGRPFLPGRKIDFNIAHTGGEPRFSKSTRLCRSAAGSGALTAVSLARGGNLRTGCDVERIRKRPGAPEIAERFFSASERDYIFNQGSCFPGESVFPDESLNEARFFQIWTLKECYLKLRGLSVFDMAAVPSFISEGSFGGCERLFSFGAAVSSEISFRLYELSGGEPCPPTRQWLDSAAGSDSANNAATFPACERYLLAIALEGAAQTQPAIRWFSQSALDCKIIAEIKAAPSPAETVSPKR